MSTATKRKHIGRNISRMRELRGMKQDAFAEAIGISQQSFSSIEGSEEVETKKLKEIAKILGVTIDAIENFSEETVFSYYNNFYDNSSNHNQVNGPNNYCTFNPLEKVVELYERLVQVEKEKVEYLEKLLKGK
ncbi:helix-turn-helix transcriptional regulator [Flavobacterium psychroterrae]|uniref:Helix-turn-helix transcriptional regulator n=1 Tax=Flavobacterium psychroterrae TaxID=2133767 RepID=A0ABS5PAZ7_9FLAO|nr:helix-turn-helix transcriptional regulator [Flavobacterium psychroterrae]MBS7230901.1 helix-turn-helix transcriptional regulator [Flavobacterium psychroterrae]